MRQKARTPVRRDYAESYMLAAALLQLAFLPVLLAYRRWYLRT